jgi:ribonuclease BN (tRNA processing enzyme)
VLQHSSNAPLDLLFLGSGNAFASEGRAFSSFLLNGRYLFDCGPTVLQQLRKANVSSHDIEVVFISHFHADHFFGLPFLLLDGHYSGRISDLTIVGPPGIEAQTEHLVRLGYPGLKPNDPQSFKRRYVEVSDLFVSNIFELAICASRVDHVDEFPCFAYRVQVGGRSLVYSGDSTLCEGLTRLVPGADVIVLECSTMDVPVHLGPGGVAAIKRLARPDVPIIVTHLDAVEHPDKYHGLTVAQDLWRYRF